MKNRSHSAALGNKIGGDRIITVHIERFRVEGAGKIAAPAHKRIAGIGNRRQGDGGDRIIRSSGGIQIHAAGTGGGDIQVKRRQGHFKNFIAGVAAAAGGNGDGSVGGAVRNRHLDDVVVYHSEAGRCHAVESHRGGAGKAATGEGDQRTGSGELWRKRLQDRRFAQFEIIVKIVMGVEITGQDQDAGAVVDVLLGGGDVIDIEIAGAFNNRSAEAGWE